MSSWESIMGEKSKRIGEIGEDIAQNFLNLLGWTELRTGIDMPCLKPQKHANPESKSGKRNAHGLDVLFSYASPSESDTLESVIVSVKYSNEPYPNNPKDKFKSYALDLTGVMECYKNSELQQEQRKQLGKFKKHKTSGVLFWLSNHNPDGKDDIISLISNSDIGDFETKFETFYVVDTRQAYFLYSSLTYIRKNYPDYEMDFYYPETTLNYNIDLSRVGKVLPVEFLTSSIILIRLRKDDNADLDIFCVVSRDDFNRENLFSLIQASKEYTSEIKCKYLFLFPDYNAGIYEYEQDFQLSKVGSSISDKITIKSYLSNLGDLSS